MRACRGYSLAELVAVMSVGAVLLGLATGVIHRTMRLESQSRDRADVHRVALRLSSSFRNDVHRSESVRIAADVAPRAMRLSMVDREDIVYQVSTGRVLRQQQIDNQVDSEVFDFPDDFAIDFTQPSPKRIELLVRSHSSPPGVEPRTVLHVVTEPGRLLRLAEIEEDTQ